METILKSVKPIALIMFLGISLSASHAMGWALSDVFKNLHTNCHTGILHGGRSGLQFCLGTDTDTEAEDSQGH